MAVTPLKNAFASIGAVDLSDHCVEVEIDDGVVELDNTVMSNTADNMQGGLRRWTIRFTLLQDYAAGKTHETLRPLINTNVALIVRPDAGVVSGTNPQWNGTGFFSRYAPIKGPVGQLQRVVAEFKNAGSSLTYATA